MSNTESTQKAVWTVKDNADFLDVTPSFYRRNVLPLPGHPKPIDPRRKNLSWWAKDMRPFLSDTKNLKWPSDSRSVA